MKRFPIMLIGLICILMVDFAAAEPPSILSVRADSGKVGLYEKFELRIDLEAAYNNPFDPDQIDLIAEFTSPSGK
jgi:hypothetical protein